MALLSIYERTSASQSHAVISHLRGVEAILTSRSATSSIASNDSFSKLTRAVLYSHWSITFLLPCVHGVRSPFDDSKWIDIEPALCHNSEAMRWDVLKLRKASHRLFLTLPGLVASVCELRTTSKRDSTGTTLRLAQELLDVRESKAENEVLHRLKVRPSHRSGIPLGGCAWR